jgi:hypothetical protein
VAVLFKTLNTLPFASVKTRNGLPVASLKKLNGLDVTPSGGGGLAPDAISTPLYAWYGASYLTGLVNNDTLTTYADHSGNGRDLADSGGGTPAKYHTNVFGTQPSVQLTGSEMTAAFFGLSAPFTFIFAARDNSALNSYWFLAGGTSSSGRIGYDPSNNWLLLPGGTVGPITRNAALHIFSITCDGSGNAEVFLDGVSQGTISGATAAWPYTLYIGSDGSGSKALCDLPEIAIYAAKPSSSDRHAVELWLGAKLGVPVS